MGTRLYICIALCLAWFLTSCCPPKHKHRRHHHRHHFERGGGEGARQGDGRPSRQQPGLRPARRQQTRPVIQPNDRNRPGDRDRKKKKKKGDS